MTGLCKCGKSCAYVIKSSALKVWIQVSLARACRGVITHNIQYVFYLIDVLQGTEAIDINTLIYCFFMCASSVFNITGTGFML